MDKLAPIRSLSALGAVSNCFYSLGQKYLHFCSNAAIDTVTYFSSEIESIRVNRCFELFRSREQWGGYGSRLIQRSDR